MPDEQPPQLEPPLPSPNQMVLEPPAVAEPINAPDERHTTVQLIEGIERMRRSKVIVYWTSPMARMSDASTPTLYDQLSAIGDVEHIDLIVHTLGGDVEVPWRMVSLIREFADKLSVIVPHRAASAGTLLALGADEIVMTRYAALGPIDPSRGHPLLPHADGQGPEPVSVQDMRHAMQFIREAGQVNGEFAYSPEAMAQIFTALFDKIHPLAIGAIEQSYALSKLIGKRCLETHMNGAGDAEKITAIVDKLCDDYKSHQYQIPRVEAKAIGLKVKEAPKRLDDALMRLYRHCLTRPMHPPNLTPGAPIRAHIAWVDSAVVGFRCEAEQIIIPGGQPQHLGDRWVTYNDPPPSS